MLYLLGLVVNYGRLGVGIQLASGDVICSWFYVLFDVMSYELGMMIVRGPF